MKIFLLNNVLEKIEIEINLIKNPISIELIHENVVSYVDLNTNKILKIDTIKTIKEKNKK